MEFYKQYPSGLRLVAKKTENCYTVSLGVYVDVGCVKESEKENGYSHFIEHMFFKGTKRRSARQISEEMDDISMPSLPRTAPATTQKAFQTIWKSAWICFPTCTFSRSLPKKN